MTDGASKGGSSLVDGFAALGITCLCFSSGLHLRSPALTGWLQQRLSLRDAVFGLLFVYGWESCFSALKLYGRSAHRMGSVQAVLKGVLLMTLPSALFVRLFHPQSATWLHIVTAVCALISFEMTRIGSTAYLHHTLSARNRRRAIIVGSGRRANKAWREIRTQHSSSIALLGFVDDRAMDAMAPEVASKYLCRVDELESTLVREVVDLIFVAMPIQSCYAIMQRAVDIADRAGVQVVYLDDIYSQQSHRSIHKSLFRELVPRQESYHLRLAAKRVVDLVGSTLGLVILAPVFLVIALGVKLSSPGDAFFCQERYGYRRRRFKMYKFRSMVQDAEKQLVDLEHANEAAGPIFKIRNDPRVTGFGRFLRATSLDELPQLWNVVRGEMSLVGPRPMSIRDVSLFSDSALMRRFIVQPGMTGMWQVNGRSNVGFEEWVALDNHYIDRWSLLLDLKILARTLGTVLKRSGAM